MEFQPTESTKIPQASRKSKNNVTFRELGIQMILVLSTATLEHRSQWNNTFKILNGNDPQLRIQYSAKLSVKCEAKMKTFLDIKVLKILTSHIPFLKKPLEVPNPTQLTPNFVAVQAPLFSLSL